MKKRLALCATILGVKLRRVNELQPEESQRDLPEDRAQDPQALERFRREARAASALISALSTRSGNTRASQLALIRDYAPKAIETLQAAAPYELGMAAGLDAVYVRGHSYLAAHEGSKATGEYQKIIDHRVIVLNPISALAHLAFRWASASN
jgi:hypothetical protein